MPSSYPSYSPSLSLPLTITLLILAFFAFTTLGFYHNGEQCSDDFYKIAEGNNITLCKKLRSLGAEFAWNYHIIKTSNTTSTTRLDILFRAVLNTPSGWVAWGVNPEKKPQMVGTKAMIAIKHSDGGTKVKTYNVTKETRLGCELRPSAIDIKVLNMSSWSSSQGPNNNIYTYISATLLLPSDKYNISKLNHVWQVGEENDVDNEDKILRHKTTLQNVDSTETIDLTSINGRSNGQPRSFLRSVHGVLNIIGWGTLLPSGVIIGRYFRVFPFKWDPTWFWLHVGFQSSGFLIGTVGWAIGLSLGHASRYYTLHTHRTFGILIFTFSTIQMLAFRLKPRDTDDYRKYWNIYHHFLGYGLITIIIINIFKGICIIQGGPGWKWTYIGILTLLGFITLVLEIITWTRFIYNRKSPIILGQKSKWVREEAPNLNK